MPHFINRDKFFIISTSYKVGYSKLRDSKSLEKIESKNQLLWLILKQKDLLKRHYFISRDPYRRVQSLFTDKFRYYPKEYMQKGQPLTKYHRHILSVLNLSSKSSYEEIKNTLLNISFEDFIKKILLQTHTLDPHSHPQYLSKKIPVVRSLGLNMPMHTKIFKLEDTEDMKLLSELTSINFSNKSHSTASYANEIKWTTEMCEIVDRIYDRDFIELNYKPSL